MTVVAEVGDFRDPRQCGDERAVAVVGQDHRVLAVARLHLRDGAVEHLLAHELPAGVHPLPAEADVTIGTAALALRGEHIDQRSRAQVDAQREWRSPRFRGESA